MVCPPFTPCLLGPPQNWPGWQKGLFWEISAQATVQNDSLCRKGSRPTQRGVNSPPPRGWGMGE